MHLKRYWHWFFLLLPFLSFQLSAQDCGNPFLSDECGPLTAAGGLDPSRPNIFCEGEEVEFINNSIGIDSTIYCWGDGSFDKVPGNQNVKHIYDFPDDTCVTNNRPLDIDIVMIVIKHCGDGKISSHRISTPVRIRLKPKADFMANAPLCNDKPIQLDNTSCPNDVMPTYLWNFGDPASGADNTSTEAEPQHSFSGGGDFPVTLSVANQCGTDTETRIITVIAPPIAQASSTLSPTSGCLPLRVNLSNESTGVTFFQWKISPNSGYSFLDSTSQFDFRPVLLFIKAGTYTITLETENECGKSNWTQTIEVSEAPVVTFRQAPIGCESLTYTPDVDYAGSISSYRWTFEGGTPSTSTEAKPQNIQYNQPGRYNVTLVVNGACGEQTFVQTVEVIGRENIIIEPVAPLCSSGDTIQLKANVLGGTWSGSPAVNAQGLFNPAQATIGMNTILYTYGPENCRSEGNIDILVQAGTTLNVGPDTTICIDQGNLQFNFSPNGGTWSGSGITNTSQGIFDPNQSGAGTFNLKYTFQEAGSGCVSSANKMVTVVGLPQLTLPDSTSICETAANINLNDLFRPITNPGNGNLTWNGPGVDENTAIFNGAQAGGVGAYNLIINYSIPPGCAVSKTVQVRVTPLIQAMASTDTTVCGSDGTLRLIGIPAGGQWSGPGINVQTGEIDLAQAGAGMRAYTYVIQANTTCESRDTTNVQIIAGGSVNAGMDIYVCETETSVTLPSANPADGSWAGPLPVNDNQINIASLAPGNYNFTYTSPSLPVACNSDVLTLNILSLPNVDFNSDSTACIGNEISFTNNTTNAQRFAWNFGNGGTSAEQNPTHIYNVAGAYSIVLEAFVLHPVTNQALCSATSAKPIKVFQAPTLVDFTMDRDSGCAELAVTVDNISIGEELQFVWQFGNFQTSDMPEPGTIIFPQGIEDTTYQVTLAVANGCGSSNATKTIHVSPKPQANFGITFEEPCSGDTLLVNNISTGNPGNFQWFLEHRTKL
ncbi:MAG: PKD domain-containing protein [Saprospiraceae bacterium]|nr:PKD domain-containing protein [Saprospiraceae bacterium]